jgi:alpha-beta hydrolase superfamily lysophospholipase
MRTTAVSFLSNGDTIAAVLTLPDMHEPAPALVMCHGALDFKENFAELCGFLADSGIATLAMDMHGHGASGGNRYHVNMGDWVSDIRSAIDHLASLPAIRKDSIGAFGFSSGGTAVLEAAVLDRRIRCIITEDATVNNTLGLMDTAIVSLLNTAGWIKRRITGEDLRLSMEQEFSKVPLTADPGVNRAWQNNARVKEMWSRVPFPGMRASFRADTLRRVHLITAPTLVIHGQEDRIDNPASAHRLHQALRCAKRICIIPGNGHMGHRDGNRQQVFSLTAQWAKGHLC